MSKVLAPLASARKLSADSGLCAVCRFSSRAILCAVIGSLEAREDRDESPSGGRMWRCFLNVLNRLSGIGGAEPGRRRRSFMGVSERTFRRWTRRYEEEGEAGLAEPPAGQGLGQAGSGRPGRGAGRGSIASATRASRSSASTSIWGRSGTASAGATPGPSCVFLSGWAWWGRAAAQGSAPRRKRERASRCRG